MFLAEAREDVGVLGHLVAEPLQERGGCVLAGKEKRFDLMDRVADKRGAGGHVGHG